MIFQNRIINYVAGKLVDRLTSTKFQAAVASAIFIHAKLPAELQASVSGTLAQVAPILVWLVTHGAQEVATILKAKVED